MNRSTLIFFVECVFRTRHVNCFLNPFNYYEPCLKREKITTEHCRIYNHLIRHFGLLRVMLKRGTENGTESGTENGKTYLMLFT